MQKKCASEDNRLARVRAMISKQPEFPVTSFPSMKHVNAQHAEPG
jgi:hypothetical protein